MSESTCLMCINFQDKKHFFSRKLVSTYIEGCQFTIIRGYSEPQNLISKHILPGDKSWAKIYLLAISNYVPNFVCHPLQLPVLTLSTKGEMGRH